ncbi:phosphoribosyl-ATP diphosphatase [Methylocapsa acidiphila]|uniref:phosphoribosyl-ATP diphosphatase n=1 Tax=Methylocapsa acidiphila TaxID=133552 RepID=UPI000405CFA6|nr:phosphoribosyl-ATP diphosphatase [Methylocapsa acidiphila]
MTTFCLEDLAAIIAARSKADAAASYTKSLLEGGPSRAAKKLGEEAVELVIAALEKDHKAVVSESADLLYHLLVVLHQSGASLGEVLEELEKRTAKSGHEEKASRRNISP